MNFSELFKQTGQICEFSPNGQYLANAVQYRLIVRDVKTLQILQLYTCLDAIQHIEWSSDSEFLLCGMYKRGLVQVWSIEEPEWTCKIDEGSAGLAEVRWSPDGRHILTTSEFSLRVTVWSLTNKSVSYIKYPKACEKGMDFSVGGKYLALAERRDCKDFISVFECASWRLVKHFETETEDLAGVQWSPDGRVLCVWESPLQYKVLLYSVDGRCLASYSAYEYALGVKSVAWSPTSQFLAIGSYDQKVKCVVFVSHWNSKPEAGVGQVEIVEHSHPARVDGSQVLLLKEEAKKPPLLKGETEPPTGVVYSSHSRYEIVEEQLSIPVFKIDPNKPNPKVGVGRVAFSNDCRYFFTRNDNMSSALWIWDMPKLNQAAILLQDNAIKCVEWDPVESRLALCTGSMKLYMWSPAGSLSVQIPTDGCFSVHKLKWHPSGKVLLLMSKDHMCVCYLGD